MTGQGMVGPATNLETALVWLHFCYVSNTNRAKIPSLYKDVVANKWKQIPAIITACSDWL